MKCKKCNSNIDQITVRDYSDGRKVISCPLCQNEIDMDDIKEYMKGQDRIAIGAVVVVIALLILICFLK